MGSARCLRCGQEFTNEHDPNSDVHRDLKRCLDFTAEALARARNRCADLEFESSHLTNQLLQRDQEIESLRRQLSKYHSELA